MGWLILEIFWRTCRIRFIGLDRLHSLAREHGAIVPVCWHQHLLIAGRFLVSDKVEPMKPGFMISPSVDGEAPSILANIFGAAVVRGSGTYSGLRAVRGACQSLEKGISLSITPDGPRGPRFKFKPGAIFASQVSGKPVVPVAYAAKPAFVLKTWDKFIIPAPFSRVCIAIGDPYFAPADLAGEQMEQVQRELERRMLETFKKARAALG